MRVALIPLALLLIAAAEVEPRPWSIWPELDDESFYNLALQPGDTYESALIVSNPEDGAPVTLAVLAVPEVNAMQGGFGLAANPGPSDLMGWLDFDAHLIDLAPGTAERLPFVLSIPANAPPGVYGGGFVAFEPIEESASEGAGVSIVILSRRGISIVAQVGEPSTCEISIESVEVNAARDGGALVILRLLNLGNVAFEGGGSLSIGNWSEVLEVGYSLPGEISYAIHAPLPPGAFQLEASVWAVDDDVCRDTLATSGDLQPLTSEPSALGRLVEDVAAYAEGLGGSPSGESTTFGIRLLLVLALTGAGTAFATVWLAWMWRYIKGKGVEKK